MTIRQITIRGFGPHADTRIDFSDFDDVFVLARPNGWGKTYIIEMVFAALYGTLPSYSGTIYDALTIGGDGRGEVVLEFEHGGDRYSVNRTVRVTEKTRSQSATLYRNDTTVAGPKVRDFTASVESVLGSQAVALATWFGSLGSLGDICSIDPAERSRLIAPYISTGNLAGISDLARTKSNVIGITVSEHEKALQSSFDIDRYELLRGTTESLERLIVEANTRYKITEQEIASIESDYQEAKTQTRLQSDYDSAQRTAEQLRSQYAQFIDPGDTSELERRVDRLNTLRKLVEQAEARNEQRSDLVAKLSEAQSLLASTPEPDDSQTDNIDDIKARLLENQTRLESDRVHCESLRERLRRVAALSEAPKPQRHNDACDECALYIDAKRHSDTVESSRKEHDDIASQLSTAERLRTDRSLEVARYQDSLRDAEVAISTAAVQMQLYADRTKAVETIERSIKEIGVVDVESERSQIESLLPDEQRLKEATYTRNRMAAIAPMLTDAEKRLKEVTEHMASFDPSVIERHDALTARLSEEMKKVFALRDEISTYAGEYAILSGQKQARETASSTITSLQKRKETLSWIAENFGRTGAQALMIEYGIKPLEQAASEIIRTATDGAFDIRIQTRRETKSGDEEKMRILVTDKSGERDIRRTSGGERKLLSTLFRMAMTEWIAKLNGTEPGTVFVDEAFDGLQPENEHLLVEALRSISDRFSQIVLLKPTDA